MNGNCICHKTIHRKLAVQVKSGWGNCGVHVCTWGYIIASLNYYKFTENDIEVARKGVANFLVRMRISDTT